MSQVMTPQQAADAISVTVEYLKQRRFLDVRRRAKGKKIYGPEWIKNPDTGRILYTEEDIVQWLSTPQAERLITEEAHA